MRPDRAKISHGLKQLGMGGIDDPGLFLQLAAVIRTHEHFRRLLSTVEPDKRKICYEALRSKLWFEPKPLDVYLAESAEIAERRQLPSYNPETAEVTDYKKPEININRLAEDAIAQSLHEKKGGRLEMTCAKCTEVKYFPAANAKEATKTAHNEGWRWTEKNGVKKQYCPKHVPTRGAIKLTCTECGKHESLRVWDPQDGYTAARRLGWIIEDHATCPNCALKALPVQ